MKYFCSSTSLLMASFVLGVDAGNTIHELMYKQQRFLLYSSRSQEGECVSICNEPSPTSPPTFDSTENPTRGDNVNSTSFPSPSPSQGPTEGTTSISMNESSTTSSTHDPTYSPTNEPTRAPTKIPTKPPIHKPTSTPTIGPTTNEPTESATKVPTRPPTKPPTYKPSNTPTYNPTNTPTEVPTGYPTKTPTREPSQNPTVFPTKIPTNTPTKNPTRLPTNRPTPSPIPIGTNHECIWPVTEFAAITKGNLISAAHSVYKKLAVGGSLVNPTHAHVTVNQKVYYGEKIEGLFNFHKGTEPIRDLTDIPIDFSSYEWLAKNMRSSDIDGKRVIVKATGSDGSNDGCYDLYDFRPDGQGYDNGNTLVVFNTDDDICIRKTRDGRPFGPSVLAPFSKVTLGDAGFVDGIVIAREFTTVDGSRVGGELQLHGNNYDGEIECIEEAQPEISSDATCQCDLGDSSDQSWKCGNAIYVCPGLDKVCKNQGNKKSKYYLLTASQCEDMKEVEINQRCIALPEYGINKPRRLSNRVCYSRGTEGMKQDESCDECTESFIPRFQNA